MPLALARATGPSPPAVVAGSPVTVMPFIDNARGHSTHELASLHAASLRVAALLGCRSAGGSADPSATRYWLPIRTLLREEAELLAIDDESQLWGGVVPHAFVGSKLVSHPLWPGGSGAPAGWCDVAGIDACALPGWSVFRRADALAASEALLAGGPVRAKSPYARGGNDQVVFDDLREVQDWLHSAACIRPRPSASSMAW